jgi:hypothetical protein
LELECTLVRSREKDYILRSSDEVARESVVLQMVTGRSYHYLIVPCTLAAVDHEFQDVFSVRVTLVYRLHVIKKKYVPGFVIAQTQLRRLPVFIFLVLVRRDVDAEEARL